MSTLLQPPATEDQLREYAEDLADEVAGQLAPSDPPDVAPTRGATKPKAALVARRQEFFGEVRAAAMSLAASPAWRAHDLTTELLLLVERLRDEIAADPDGIDPQWRVREVLQRMLTVLQAMVRQLMHAEIDRPEQAARFVADTLDDVGISEVAALLGISSRMVGNYRKGDVGQIRKDPARITTVGQLVYELHGSMTPRGVLLWFDARVPQLDGRTPRELLDEDPATHRAPLIALARGGRAQLDQGGVAYGAVEQAA